MMDAFAFPRIWTFGNGQSLYPKCIVLSDEYEDALEQALKFWDDLYHRLKKEPPVSWSPVLIGVELDTHRTRIIENAAKRLERARQPQWTDEEFEIWWNHDPFFTQQQTGWGHFSGTRKEYAIWEAKQVLGIE